MQIDSDWVALARVQTNILAEPFATLAVQIIRDRSAALLRCRYRKRTDTGASVIDDIGRPERFDNPEMLRAWRGYENNRSIVDNYRIIPNREFQ